MNSIWRVFASGLLLSGCAGGGRFVSTGPLDYTKLHNALACEILSAYDVDQENLHYLDGGSAKISTKIEGKFIRGADANVSVPAYGIGRASVITGAVGGSRKFTDTGTINLERSIKFEEVDRTGVECGYGYDVSAINLQSWYRSISEKAADGKVLLSSIEFERKVEFVFGENSISLKLLDKTPFERSFGAGFKLTNNDTATITIKFFRKPEKKDKEPLLVTLDKQTLDELSKIFSIPGYKPKPPVKFRTDEIDQKLPEQIRDLQDKIQTLTDQNDILLDQ